MPRHDIYHDNARNALIHDGWIITHDPLTLPYRRTDVYIDLGAQTSFGASKGECKIAVEIKSFQGASEVFDLQQALGQYRLYRFVLARRDPERICYLAITEDAYKENFADAEAQELLAAEDLRLIVFDPQKEVLVKWMPLWKSESEL